MSTWNQADIISHQQSRFLKHLEVARSDVASLVIIEER